MKVLIAGDSFSSNEKTPFRPWFDFLWRGKSIINVARPGAGNFFIAESVQNIIKSNNFKKILIFWSSVYRFDWIVETTDKKNIKQFQKQVKADPHLNRGFVGKKLFICSTGPKKENFLTRYILEHSEKIKQDSVEKIIETNQLCERKIGKENYKFGFSLIPDQDVYEIFKNESNFIWPSIQEYGEQVNGIAKGFGAPIDGHLDQSGHEKFAEYMKNRLVDRSP